ncbi:MAG: DUF418 domain-containing protein [Bacteroidia bacterium]|nr:DUF418 domain-containing protein [Bacteroidia bacterium]
MEDYFPVNVPFFMITAGWALMVISLCMFLGDKFSSTKLVNMLSQTGKITLTLYVFHMFVGVLLLSILSHKKYTGFPQTESPLDTGYILLFAIVLFGISVLGSYLWSKKFKNGPIETMMRKISEPNI